MIKSGGPVCNVADIDVPIEMIIAVVVVLVGRVVCGYFVALTATGTTPARCCVDTREAFLDAATAYRRGAVAFEVFAAAFIAC
jgi:hypothetical protein